MGKTEEVTIQKASFMEDLVDIPILKEHPSQKIQINSKLFNGEKEFVDFISNKQDIIA